MALVLLPAKAKHNQSSHLHSGVELSTLPGSLVPQVPGKVLWIGFSFPGKGIVPGFSFPGKVPKDRVFPVILVYYGALPLPPSVPET